MIVPDPHSPTGQRVKLLDFGVAKLRDSDHLTKSGSILGTPLYMALEQFKNSADVDGKADVFALGVIAYQLLTGRLPHYGATHYEIMGARLLNPIKPLSQLAPHIPAAVISLVMAMLEKEPAERPDMATVDLEVRRTLGLPPPRISGFHDIVAASRVAPLVPNSPGPSEDSLQRPTVDAPAGTLDLTPAQPPTPSDVRAAGELSPRNVPVPISLSSLPSVPVPVPALRASPMDRTSAGAPDVLVAAAVASPSSPTSPERPRRAPGVLVGIALSLGVAVIVAGTALWWRLSHESMGPATGKPAQPAAATAPPALASPAKPTGDGPPSVSPALEPTTPQPEAGARVPGTGCAAQVPTKSCIITPQLTMHQRDSLLTAFAQSGAAFCPGEPLALSGLPAHPRIASTPPSLRGDGALIRSLQSQLDEGDFPSEIEIRCQPSNTPIIGAAPPGATDLAPPAAASSPHHTTKAATHKRCQAVRVTSACVPKGTITDAQRVALVSAMFDAGIKLCSSDRFIVTMSATDLGVRSAPSSISREAQDIFTNSLRGRLKGTPWRGELEIRCPAP